MNTQEMNDLGVGAADAEQAKIIGTIVESQRRECWELQQRLQQCVEANTITAPTAANLAVRIGGTIQRIEEGQSPCEIEEHLSKIARVLSAFEIPTGA